MVNLGNILYGLTPDAALDFNDHRRVAFLTPADMIPLALSLRIQVAFSCRFL